MIVPDLNLYVNQSKVDIVKIINYLKSFKFTFQDSNDEKVYFLCDCKESQESLDKRNKEIQKELGSGNYSYSSTLVKLFRTPNLIEVVTGSSGEKELEQFITWIFSQNEIIRITDDYGTDWTERVKKEGIDILFKQEKHKKGIRKV